MRNKIVMITALLAMMVGITGIAAAGPFNIAVTKPIPDELVPAANPTLIPVTGTTTFSLHLTSINSNNVPTGTYSLTCSIVGGSGEVSVTTCPSGFTATAIDMVLSNSVVITSVNANPSIDYQLIVDGATVATVKPDPAVKGGITLNAAIPEFPAVALPVGAVIGLVFLFQHRKNKKE